MSKKNIILNKIDDSKLNLDKSKYFNDLSNDLIINNINPNESLNKTNNVKNINNSHLSDIFLVNQLNLKKFSDKNFNFKINNKENSDNIKNPENISIEKNNKFEGFHIKKAINNSEILKDESFGNFSRNKLTNKNNTNLWLDANNDKQLNMKFNKNDNLIINNLEKELQGKNEEIKIMKNNFKEKIELLENENKKTVNKLEDQFNHIIENVNKNYIENVSGLEINTLHVKNEYDDTVMKLHSNILNLKNKSVELNKHENIIQDIKTKAFMKIEDYKNNYEDKLKELINYFDKPEYRKLIQNINFYMKFKEKIDFTPEDLNFIEHINFSDQEYDLWMDRIKLNLITAECDYLNGVMELENNYLQIYEKIKSSEIDKFINLENEINEKFDVF